MGVAQPSLYLPAAPVRQAKASTWPHDPVPSSKGPYYSSADSLDQTWSPYPTAALSLEMLGLGHLNSWSIETGLGPSEHVHSHHVLPHWVRTSGVTSPEQILALAFWSHSHQLNQELSHAFYQGLEEPRGAQRSKHRVYLLPCSLLRDINLAHRKQLEKKIMLYYQLHVHLRVQITGLNY